MYKINKNPNGHNWDVDDTLIFGEPIEDVEPIFITNERGVVKAMWPNYLEIENLKMCHFRGHYIRVHSQGGWEWTKLVIDALELQNYVDHIETKVKWYHDDLPADSWMKHFYKDPRKK